jgi:hypothetical protein
MARMAIHGHSGPPAQSKGADLLFLTSRGFSRCSLAAQAHDIEGRGAEADPPAPNGPIIGKHPVVRREEYSHCRSRRYIFSLRWLEVRGIQALVESSEFMREK